MDIWSLDWTVRPSLIWDNMQKSLSEIKKKSSPFNKISAMKMMAFGVLQMKMECNEKLMKM